MSCTGKDDIIEESLLSNGIKYLALGDSYTIGQSVDESLRWPNQLGEKLTAINCEIDSIK